MPRSDTKLVPQVPPFKFEVDAPTAADAFFVGHTVRPMRPIICTSETDTGTVTFNLEHRAYGSAFAAGTDILSSDLVADSDGQSTAVFSGVIAANRDIWLTITSVADSPAEFRGTLLAVAPNHRHLLIWGG